MALEGTVLALVLVVRRAPVATFVRHAPFGYSACAEQVVLGWAGLRGAVPVVLATFPVIDGVPRSHEFFNIVFFAVVLSTIAAGHDLRAARQRLGVTTDEPALPRPLAESGTIRRLGAEVVEFPVAADDAIVGLAVRDLGLPARGGGQRDRARRPGDPAARLDARRAGDRLHVLYREEASRQLVALTRRWRS